MSDIYTTSDTHFGHQNILKFLRNDGSLLRPGFATIEDHDEHLISQWNSVVKPGDKVYHLGDVVISKKFLQHCKRLNGHKRLVRGNHDIFKTQEYIDAGFEEIYGCRVFSKQNAILTHIPLHPECLRDRKWLNIHGHLHINTVKQAAPNETLEDPNYVCVSVEHLDDYKPVALYPLIEKRKLFI